MESQSKNDKTPRLQNPNTKDSQKTPRLTEEQLGKLSRKELTEYIAAISLENLNNPERHGRSK